MMRNLIDFEELLERTENDRGLMRDLLTIFKDEFRQRLQSLSQAVMSRNEANVILEAHALKGMFSNLAVIEVAAAVAELERLAPNNETSKLFGGISGNAQQLRSSLRPGASRKDSHNHLGAPGANVGGLCTHLHEFWTIA